MRMTRRILSLSLSLSLSLLACVDNDPVGQNAGADPFRPQFSATTLPDDLIFEDEPMLEIARAMPSFGGFYYNDRGEIEVLLTSAADFAEARQRIAPHLGAHRALTTRFNARVATYSFFELARYRTVLRQQIFGIPGVVSLGVRESANRVKVGIEDAAVEAEVRELMSEVGVPQAAVMFVLQARGQDLALIPPASMSTPGLLTLQDQQPDGVIQGGWEIQSGGGTCTLGFPALRASDALPVFITNSHCTAIRTYDDGGAFFQPAFGEQIGNEIDDPPDYVCVFSCLNPTAGIRTRR